MTPERIEATLADFRDWLTSSMRENPVPPDSDSLPDAPDLFTLLGQMTALRQEVKLQTRSTRAQQEQNAETLTRLTTALDLLRQGHSAASSGRQKDRDEQLRPLLTTLVDLHDALAVAAREVRRVQEELSHADTSVTPTPLQPPPEPPPLPPRPSMLLRLLGARGPDRNSWASFHDRWKNWRERENTVRGEKAAAAREAAVRAERLTDALATGYTMSLRRLERALERYGLEAVPAVGLPFDPERMEAVEAVADSGEPPGRVLEEVLRGYFWEGRVFRFARVRVAKSSGSRRG